MILRDFENSHVDILGDTITSNALIVCISLRYALLIWRSRDDGLPCYSNYNKAYQAECSIAHYIVCSGRKFNSYATVGRHVHTACCCIGCALQLKYVVRGQETAISKQCVLP